MRYKDSATLPPWSAKVVKKAVIKSGVTSIATGAGKRYVKVEWFYPDREVTNDKTTVFRILRKAPGSST